MGCCFDMLRNRWSQDCFVCVGLDPVQDNHPGYWINEFPSLTEAMWRFNRRIVRATAPYACAFKLNSAFYEAFGIDGWQALKTTINDIRIECRGIPVIMDAKRGDIGSTNKSYARAIFDELKADAVTLNPYLGGNALAPFLRREDKGCFILCRTSNPGAGEFQDLLVDGRPLYLHVAEHVAKVWNEIGNCGLVVGATYPNELRLVREVVGEMPILIPGIGTQGGDLRAAVRTGMNSKGDGMIISASRSIAFASDGPDFAEAAEAEARRINEAIKAYREELL